MVQVEKPGGRLPVQGLVERRQAQRLHRIFRPGTGTLFGFYSANLKGSIDQQGNRFIPSTRFGHAIGYTGPFLKCRRSRAQDVAMTFPGKSDGPLGKNFEINLHSVSDTVAEVTFDINGASHTYKTNPKSGSTSSGRRRMPRVSRAA